jgi:hypothetical protein
VRQQVDADTQGPEVADAFDHGRFDARGVQAQRGGQPADPGPGNEYPHDQSRISSSRYKSTLRQRDPEVQELVMLIIRMTR